MINDRRLDARASHFTVGFDNEFAAPVQTQKGSSVVKPNEINSFEANKQKMSRCNISMGQQTSVKL